MSERFCKDCKWMEGHRQYPEHAKSWKCNVPRNVLEEETSNVTGEMVRRRRFTYCTEMRKHFSDFTCGPEGKFFEKADPFYEQIQTEA